jgi:L-ascorbate metabolism protein UlaG (beta-lactamase superfamily)
MLTGDALMADVAACRMAAGECVFWWLGQHSFILKLGDTVVLADPFLSPLAGRLVPSLLKPEEVRGVQIVLGSHDHADHIDRPAWPAMAAANPEAVFVVPAPVAPGLQRDLRLGEARIIGLRDGESVTKGGVTVSALPAAHEILERPSIPGAYAHLGFVVKGNGVILYHAGDTCLYEGMQDRLRAHRPQIMFLPINGRDAKRLRAGCIGNMTYQEAADLAGALEPALTVPAHFEMFAGNTEDPALFAEYMAVKYPALRTCVPVHGVPTRVAIRAGDAAVTMSGG